MSQFILVLSKFSNFHIMSFYDAAIINFLCIYDWDPYKNINRSIAIEFMSDTWKRITGSMMLVSLLGLGGVYFKNMFGFSDMINKAVANVPNLKDLTKLSKHDFDRMKPNIIKNNNLPNKDSKNKRVTKINNNPYKGYQNREINRPNKINKKKGFKWKLGGRGLRFAKERKKLNRIFKKNEKELVKIIEADNMPSKNALNNGDAINESKGMLNILSRIDADHFENNKNKIRHSRKFDFDAKENKSNYGSNLDSIRDSDFALENDNVKFFVKNPLKPKTVSHENPESIPILSDKSKRSADQIKTRLLQNEQEKVSKTNIGQLKHSSDHGAIGEDQNNALEGIFIDDLVAKTLELVQNEQNMPKELYIPKLTANIYRFDSEDATNADFVQELQSLQRAHNANIVAAGLFEQLHEGILEKEVDNAAASDSVKGFITNDKHPETGIKKYLTPKKDLKRTLRDVRTENQAFDLQQEKKQKIESNLDDLNYDKIDYNKIKVKKGDETEKKPVYGSITKGDVVSQVGGLRHVRLRNFN